MPAFGGLISLPSIISNEGKDLLAHILKLLFAMGKRQMDVNMTLPKNGKKPATHLGQLKDPVGGASGGGGVSLKISICKYCTDASVYNTEFFSSRSLYQYLLQPFQRLDL